MDNVFFLNLGDLLITVTLKVFFTDINIFSRNSPTNYVRLDQDILSPLAGKKQLYTYETMDFWEQIKTPG